MSSPLLSICLITYNQQDYIQQAIEGVFSQKVDFPVEFVISNDCSSDGTHQKIDEILTKAPDNFSIKYFNHENNLGALQNFSFALNQCTGKYIAYFEGDDYWIDPLKLTSQVDFLEKNQDFAICFHNIWVLENGKLSPNLHLEKYNIKEESSIEDYAKFNYIPTLSAVFRNVEQKLPDWIMDSPVGDIPLFMTIAKQGKIKFFNEKWGVYRKNVGIWCKMGNQRNLNMMKLYDYLIYDYQNLSAVKTNLYKAKYSYIKEFLKKEKLGFIEFLNNKFFEELPLQEKLKIIYRKYIKQ